MALDMFRITKGLELDGIQVLEGAGNPGAAGDTSLAPVGSLYLDHNSGAIWSKVTAGVGTDKWEKQASQAYVDAAVGATISWREPVRVRDSASTTLPVGVAGNAITVDGVSITNDQRVLFSAISAGAGPNIYVYNQTTGLFVEDTNNETAGDTTYVIAGTDAGKRYTYNGTAWIQTDGTTMDELGFIRSFIGKNAAGSETPNYSSTNQVTQGGSLETAIGELDTNLGADVTTNTIITNTNSANTNIQAIANFVESSGKVINALNVTTITTIDSVVAEVAKWIIRAEQVGTLTNVYAAEIMAIHDGTNVDHSKYGILKLGVNINGLVVDVTLSGGNTLNITVTSTAAVNVTVKRLAAAV